MPLSNLLRTLQVFPLLIKKFSREEQADLVWQFLCSIPVHMMAEFLPWISASVSPDENQDILDCLHKIVPEEKLLQEVLMIMTSCTLASIYKAITYFSFFYFWRLYLRGLEGNRPEQYHKISVILAPKAVLYVNAALIKHINMHAHLNTPKLEKGNQQNLISLPRIQLMRFCIGTMLFEESWVI